MKSWFGFDVCFPKSDLCVVYLWRLVGRWSMEFRAILISGVCKELHIGRVKPAGSWIEKRKRFSFRSVYKTTVVEKTQVIKLQKSSCQKLLARMFLEFGQV